MGQAKPRAVVFDAYGTLFDVHSVIATCGRIFPRQGDLLSEIWRRKQLQYSWLRALMGHYCDFWQVTLEALDAAVAALELELEPQQRREILESYYYLEPYPEVREVLAALAGRRRLILSNGAPEMLRRVVDNSGIAGELEALLSADAVRTFKPDPRVYGLALEHLGLPRREIAFVSANTWDAVGARAFGFFSCWLNRSGAAAEVLGVTPDLVLRDLGELAFGGHV